MKSFKPVSANSLISYKAVFNPYRILLERPAFLSFSRPSLDDSEVSTFLGELGNITPATPGNLERQRKIAPRGSAC